MPANAEIMYKTVYKIATFDLPFVGNFVKKMKAKLTTLVPIKESKI